MAEYLAPGVYIEEVPSGSRPIEGVATSTAGFVGAATAGPVNRAFGPITSLGEFEQTFGPGTPIEHDGLAPMPNFLWHAVRAFFAEGGRRLWIVRVKRAGCRPAGARPKAYQYCRGLAALARVREVSIVAAPGASYGGDAGYRDDAMAVSRALVAHAERQRDRIALLDPPPGLSIAGVRDWRAPFRSSYAALYYPWVRAASPSGAGEVVLPPSGAIAGIYARTDIERGVHKPPANEVLRSALGFERDVNKAEQEVLNPESINCLRAFEGRGLRVWGGRTLADDPEWKYVNVRRLFIFLEQSIDRGLQWAVFEPNAEPLWQKVRANVENFLYGQWRNGVLLGDKPERAYFVRCDRTTMTQNDIDNGRLVVEIGAAPVRPAEFVIFRVGLWMVDRKP